MTTTPNPAIWIGCLAAYNEGRLHGEWITLTNDMALADLQDAIDHILATSPSPHAEEWHLCDAEHFAGWTPDRYEQLSTIHTAATYLRAFGPAMFGAAIAAAGTIDDALLLLDRGAVAPAVDLSELASFETGRAAVMDSLLDGETLDQIHAAIRSVIARRLRRLNGTYTDMGELAGCFHFNADAAALVAECNWGWQFGERDGHAAAWSLDQRPQ